MLLNPIYFKSNTHYLPRNTSHKANTHLANVNYIILFLVITIKIILFKESRRREKGKEPSFSGGLNQCMDNNNTQVVQRVIW